MKVVMTNTEKKPSDAPTARGTDDETATWSAAGFRSIESHTCKCACQLHHPTL